MFQTKVVGFGGGWFWWKLYES